MSEEIAVKAIPSVVISQMELVAAITEYLREQEGIETALSRQMNAIIAAANLIVDAFNEPLRENTPNMGLAKWLNCDDTGLSSKFMAHILVHGPMVQNEYPHDPSDFGRCYRFLLAVPEARERLDLLRRQSKEWDVLIMNWSKLESLWEEESPSGKALKLFNLMKQLLDETHKTT